MSIYRTFVSTYSKSIKEGDILIFGKRLIYKVKNGRLRRVFRPLPFLFEHFCLLIPDLNNTIFKITGVKAIAFDKENHIYRPNDELSSKLEKNSHHTLTAITKELFIQIELIATHKKKAIEKAEEAAKEAISLKLKKEEYRKDPIKAVKDIAQKAGIEIAFTR